MGTRTRLAAVVGLVAAAGMHGGWEGATARANPPQAAAADADRMGWWRDARFGLFIHWGLYAVPAGEWGSRTDHAEWIRHTARIPRAEYEGLRSKFNPVKFDAGAIARAAKDAGMGYVVITTKHHDGFALFDSAATEWDVMSTPWRRDAMREIADAVRGEGMKIGWYYSIMDWSHPDYLPRRDWEADRPADGADMDRYVSFMKEQLRELLTKYGEIGVLWFDGQWEGTWNDERGADLERMVRGLAPGIIINSRVGRSGGAYGLDDGADGLGDYATPEQFIPERMPQGDWETCMTMNGTWGYNRADRNFKSTGELLSKLADIASKGGNFLLNIGPDGEGAVPQESLDRLAAIGRWMRVRGESIHGTAGGVLQGLRWGRCTQKAAGTGTTLYLHVLDRPADGRLVVPGLLSEVTGARVLGETGAVEVERAGDDVVLRLPALPEIEGHHVVVLEVSGHPDVAKPPEVTASSPIFTEWAEVRATTDRAGVEVRYTTDGSEPTASSPVATGPVRVTETSTVSARCFRDGRAVSPTSRATVTRVSPRPAAEVGVIEPGVSYEVFELPGDITTLESMSGLMAARRGESSGFETSVRPRERNWGARWTGLLRAPETGVYELWTASDDGSRLWIGDQLVVENDRPHSVTKQSGVVALSAGWHAVRVEFFENWGGYELKVGWSGPGVSAGPIPPSALGRAKAGGRE